jgi:superfamily II DNA or RNA helicase
MPPKPELLQLESIDPARLQAVADWIQANVRPAAQVLSGDILPEDQPQAPQFDERDYQLEAWVKLEERRAEGGTRALGNLATGLGKTFVTAIDVARYKEWCAAQSPPLLPRVLYVSHQNDINVQAEKTFRFVMPDADFATFDPSEKQVPDADVTFATIQGLYQNLALFDPEDYEYIIWDETHHLEAETFKKVRDYFRPLFEHGVTATVARMDGKDIQEYFGAPLYKKSLPEGIAEGYLKDVDYHIVFDKSIKDKLKGGFEPKTLQDIKDLFKEKPPRDAIARSIKEEIEKLGLTDPKMIVFCEDIDEANEMAELLGGVAYHSGTKNRQQKLDDFRAGRNLIMTTRDMFNEGVDIPDAEVSVFLRGTGSNTIFEQQLGRVLRKSAGKPKAYVLDFVANIERIAKVRELSENIQRRAREIGQRDVVEEGIVLDGQEQENYWFANSYSA